ncbi:MAG: pyridoxamine 5'-phosphate oxidase [Candidatus Kariarchaeaceae archaeon]|jgi:pyridoxamine 5'-phosphate oxidase
MGLDISDMANSPFDQFRSWFATAEGDERISLPHAMCVSTIGEDGYPDSRYVLLKHIFDDSIAFYTNLTSKKGRDLSATEKIAVTFYWEPLRRQVRFQGIARLIDPSIADDYFSSRSRGSQVGAWASKQSQPLQSREVLMEQVTEYSAKFAGEPIPRPEFWSGFQIFPHRIEFWQNAEDRLHDRFVYTLLDDIWTLTRLYP